MANCYQITNGRLIFKNNGEDCIDDSEKKHIPNTFTEIEFPPCFDMIYGDDFKWCKEGLSRVTLLDFSKATGIEDIADDAFKGASSLEVVVLPKKVDYINEFKNCPRLKEIHIFKMENTYTITDDEDKRLVVYASNVTNDVDSFSDGFLADVGILYVPQSQLKRLQKALDEYDDELDIRPLPAGYSFPNKALSKPWTPSGSSASSSGSSSSSSRSSSASSRSSSASSSSSSASSSSSTSARLQSKGGTTTETRNSAPAKEEKDESSDLLDLLLSDSDDTSQEEEVQEEFDVAKLSEGPQFHCVLEGKSFGPVTLRQFSNMARYGIVNGSTLVFKQGMSNWAIASSVADLQGLV